LGSWAVSLAGNEKKQHKQNNFLKGIPAMKKALITAAALMIVFCATESFAGGRYGGYRSYGFSSPKSYSYGGFSNYKFYSPAPSRNYSNGGEIYMQN